MIKPRRFINYSKYCFFMSDLANEYKRLGYEQFRNKYNDFVCFGIYKRYLKAYMEYLYNKECGIKIKPINEKDIPKRLVLDPYTYAGYFRFKMKHILNERLEWAVPEFLKYGILVVEVQEAVRK